MTQPDDDEAIHAPARLEALVIDRDPAVRAWALTRLGEVAPAGAGRAALMALGDDDPTVQSAALGVLEQVQPEGMRAALRSYSGRRGVWQGLKARARRLAEVKGSTPPLADQALVSAPAEIPPDQLLARLEAAVATDREPVEESATEDVEALLQRHPASLRAIAPAILARGDEDDRRVPVIVALGRQRQRWATRLLLEHLDALLATREEALVWEAFGDLGDPAALEALIAAWREGERTGARAIAQIARIADRYDALPSPLRAEAEAQRTLSAQMEKHIADGQRAGQLDALLGDRDLFLRLRCLRCRRTFGYEVPQALLHPDPDACHSDGWDGVYLLRIIRCKGCGAVDQYELTTQALLVLMGGTAAHGGRVTIGQAQVLEGKFIRRASEGLRLVRAETERHPDSAEAWLRLGNLCRRLAEPAEMERAFRRSKELAPNGLDAVVTLADVLWGQGRWSEATAEIQESVARLAKCDRGQSRDEIASLFDLIAETLRGNSGSLALRVGWMVPGTSSDRPTMSLSSIDLRRVSRWEDLCDFLVEADLITTGLTTEVPNPADGPTQIEVALGRRAFGAKRTPKGVATSGSPIASLPRRTGARVGRNAPCPCGSGKKYKKCCGG